MAMSTAGSVTLDIASSSDTIAPHSRRGAATTSGRRWGSGVTGRVALVLLASSALWLAGCVTLNVGPTASPTPSPSPTSNPVPIPVSMSGAGGGLSVAFSLPAGEAVVQWSAASDDTECRLIVDLVDPSGASEHVTNGFVPAGGSRSGEADVDLAGGPGYRFDLGDTSCTWRIQMVTQSV